MKTIAQQLNIKDFPLVIRDKNGNRIYFENSTKYWTKREFDSKGNRIYYENSHGYWAKYELDSNGELIYSENSNGRIRDNRPKPTCNNKEVEIDGVKYKLTRL